MKRLVICIFISIVLTGCMRLENGNHIYNDSQSDHLAAEKIFATDDRLVSTATIIHDDKLLSGVTVKTFSRLHKQKIEDELTKKLEEAYPEHEITVSADNKIVHETVKIVQNKDKEQLDEQLKRIVSLLKEET